MFCLYFFVSPVQQIILKILCFRVFRIFRVLEYSGYSAFPFRHSVSLPNRVTLREIVEIARV